jgi:hypothetical protein
MAVYSYLGECHNMIIYCTFQEFPHNLASRKAWRFFKLKNTIFWDLSSCSLVDVCRCFGGTYCLHLQGQRVSWASKQYLPHDIPEDSNLHSHCHETSNLSFLKVSLYIARAVKLFLLMRGRENSTGLL